MAWATARAPEECTSLKSSVSSRRSGSACTPTTNLPSALARHSNTGAKGASQHSQTTTTAPGNTQSSGEEGACTEASVAKKSAMASAPSFSSSLSSSISCCSVGWPRRHSSSGGTASSVSSFPDRFSVVSLTHSSAVGVKTQPSEKRLP